MKYLGCALKRNEHISKANRILGFLKRNLNMGATKVKENAWKPLVRPSVEYASSECDPYQQNNIKKSK